jgi:hypothetical protein
LERTDARSGQASSVLDKVKAEVESYLEIVICIYSYICDEHSGGHIREG